MKVISIFGSIFLLILLAVKLIITQHKKALQRRQEAEQRQREELERLKAAGKLIIESHYPGIQSHNQHFEWLTSNENGYFNHTKLSDWKTLANAIYQEIDSLATETFNLDIVIVKAVKEFKTYYTNGEAIRRLYNEKFLTHELKACETLLSNIEGQSLDEQQRLAVIKDEDNNLVIAGAGSGKTTTVAGKVAYVINRRKVQPEEILLITFTKKASEEMQDRIKKKMNIDIEVNTFHSFGRKVIGEVTQDMPSVIEENRFYATIKDIFKTLFLDHQYSEKVIEFITQHRLEPKDINDFQSHGDYITFIKDNNIRSYKTVEVSIHGRMTMIREFCKSLEEVKIANYLFLNGVNYIYENLYKFKTADNKYSQYKPDFYLPDYDMYIEHFGLIDQDNNVPHWFSGRDGLSAKEKYNRDIAWKREIHEKYETTLVETFSYENKQGTLLEQLRKKLAERGVLFKPRSTTEIWEILNSTAKEEVTALETLIYTFLNLFKSNNFDIEKLTKQIEVHKDKNIKTRYLLFLDIFAPILEKYNEFLKAENLIDFSDMINAAANYISNNQFKNKFKYIIIDEFQDTSIGRFNLIHSLLKNNTSCKLFAVGDDWQSIYRFAGSDISLFTQFESYFGVTAFSKIETTYRFNKCMIDISSKFILTNPNQAEKSLKPFIDNGLYPLEVIQTKSFTNDDPAPFIAALNQINDENPGPPKEIKILALARYNHIINLYKERTDLFKVTYNINDRDYTIIYRELPHLKVKFLSVHRSKGLQGDYVIVLNCVSGQYGFPSEQADDPILNLLLSKSDQFLNGEERRLFYVALTRAKKKTFITTSSIYTSKFIDEIWTDSIAIAQDNCPVCIKGRKVKKEGINKNGNPYIKFTCSNWNFGCEYLEWGKAAVQLKDS